jgi:hypothetical protein
MNRVWFRSQIFQKAIISFIMSVCQRWTTRLSLAEFSYHLISEYFFRKSVEIIQVSLKSEKHNCYFHMKMCVHVWQYLALFFSEWEIFQTEIVEKSNTHFIFSTFFLRGTRLRSWLRHCATRRKVAGSIPDGVIWFFHWHNLSGRTMGSIQSLTEISSRNISWGVKVAGA